MENFWRGRDNAECELEKTESSDLMIDWGMAGYSKFLVVLHVIITPGIFWKTYKNK